MSLSSFQSWSPFGLHAGIERQLLVFLSLSPAYVLQVGVLVEFTLVGNAGAGVRLPSQLLLLLLLLLMVVVAVLSWSVTPQGQTTILMEQPQRGVGSAGSAVAGRAPLHLVHGLRDGGQGGRRRVGVQVRGGAEEGGLVEPVGRVGGDGRRVRQLPPRGTVTAVYRLVM